MRESLIENIQSKIKLSTEEIEIFNTFWKERKLVKNEYIFRNGEICKFDSFVISGSFKAFYIHPDTGKEEIIFFAIENWWATDLDSFSNQSPSMYAIQAIENSIVLQINYPSFEELLRQIPKLERYFRLILQGYNSSIQRRIILTNSHSAEERYRDFVQRYPKIIQKVPQYLIASYLGITPEFLSKIRGKKN
ncbi:Crp/Fnr family transcriptional regulator [Sphingobacterium sp. SRCM116780]|uniref:Crp/Fnr family transcriptional regulator n=1 Tax=Sphingobacterium sp. SRCM116780 TaxID=2907623 RepID=UPI001F2D2ACC|nr:Crp/Fnr family transcriptional regulator [Sphingobacterium sp. SRCM116780]UIR54664.1 Crp/Fnr family transcriptional regulator [Sphingobacterium sp. SRCM116780]